MCINTFVYVGNCLFCVHWGLLLQHFVCISFFFTFFEWLSVRLKATKLSSENSYYNEQSALVLKESES